MRRPFSTLHSLCIFSMTRIRLFLSVAYMHSHTMHRSTVLLLLLRLGLTSVHLSSSIVFIVPVPAPVPIQVLSFPFPPIKFSLFLWPRPLPRILAPALTLRDCTIHSIFDHTMYGQFHSCLTVSTSIYRPRFVRSTRQYLIVLTYVNTYRSHHDNVPFPSKRDFDLDPTCPPSILQASSFPFTSNRRFL